jgi:hypothetical protein
VLGGSAVWVWAIVWSCEARLWVWVDVGTTTGIVGFCTVVVADGAPVVRTPLAPVFAADDAIVVYYPLAVPAVALLCLM